MEYINSIAEKGTYVSLIADYPADKLYEKFGFKTTEPKSGGMYIVFNYKTTRTNRNHRKSCIYIVSFYDIEIDCPSGFIDLTMHQNQ